MTDKIHYIKKGEGTPVVLLHGFCESSTIWASLASDLVSQYPISTLIPDMPGFGKSPLPSDPFELDEIATMLHNWLRSLGINKCVMIGHSLGGYVTLSFLKQYPEMISGYGLFNSTAYADTDDKKENRNKLIDFIGQHGVKPFIGTFVPSLFKPERVEEFTQEIEMIKEEGAAINPKTVQYYATAMRDRDEHLELLRKYASNGLLIAGVDDQNVPLSASKEMGKLLKKEHVHFLEATAHMGMFEQKSQSIKAIGEFVASVAK